MSGIDLDKMQNADGKSSSKFDAKIENEIKESVKAFEQKQDLKPSEMEIELANQLAVEKEKSIRLAAELDNLQKRTYRQLEEARDYAVTSLLKDLSMPFEQLFIAFLSQIPEDLVQNEFVKSTISGLELIKSEFEKVLGKAGLKRLFPKGEKFDPNFHQAMSQIAIDGLESGTIYDVIQAGFSLKDRCIKPALVVVAK